jgi:diaminohydroxyphosphoribosylaminopyrimidine deaminase/5-amino-6-(5-phosphoribosylamino)uracil reductase
MARALDLAEKGRFTTSPNPMVGACIVRGSRLVGEGYHRIFGGDHAEVDALKKAGGHARGASLYVTLEPCTSWGKTPPCVNAIVRAGIRKVVVAVRDPNPKHDGKGIAALRKAGIRVSVGVLAGEARRQNEAFFKYVKTGIPFVTLKMAQSLDGKIAARSGVSRWISSPPARQFVHQLRAEQDAILVGKNTLYLDDPRLSPLVKYRGQCPQKPWRIVLDPDFKVNAGARVFKGDQLTMIAVSRETAKRLENKGDRSKKSGVLIPLACRKGRLDIGDLLKQLGSLGVAKLLVEGGGELAWSFLSEKRVDRAYWIIAPKIVGGRSAKTSVEGEGFGDLDGAITTSYSALHSLGPDLLISTDFKTF